MIKVDSLFHTYNKNKSYTINNMSFQVAKGEIFGFLGPSGAGKSTTQGILTGLLPLQKGNVEVAGYNMKKPERKMFNDIGVFFEEPNTYDRLSALENLEFYRHLYQVDTIEPMELLKALGLESVANKKTSTFSKDMKHRLTFARSMLNKPKLWFLDEPIKGMEPSEVQSIVSIIKSKNNEGTTVFLTSHNMNLVDDLCNRLAFIVGGEIKLIDSPKNLKLKYGEQLVEVEHVENGLMLVEKFSILIDDERRKLNHLINTGNIKRMHTKEATLEEIFIKVTGRELR